MRRTFSTLTAAMPCGRRPFAVVMVSLVCSGGLVGCAHADGGLRIRSGWARVDARQVITPTATYVLESDGTWAGPRGERYRLEGDRIVNVTQAPGLVRPYGFVRIERHPDGVHFRPSYTAADFGYRTDDGRPIPRELEVPLFLASRLGIEFQGLRLSGPEVAENGAGAVPDTSGRTQ